MTGTGSILYQGHASVRICTSNHVVIYIDPYAGGGYDLPADIVLMTHAHGDHCRLDLIRQKEGCVVIPHTDACRDGAYKSFDVGDVHIQAFPAYNEKHPRAAGGTGFLISFDGIKVYLAGDTSKIAEMAELQQEGITYAFLPCDGFFNMDSTEAGECAALIGARHSIPYHTCRNTDGDFSKENAEKFVADGRMILQPMQHIAL